jgi:hypothetical protein
VWVANGSEGTVYRISAKLFTHTGTANGNNNTVNADTPRQD